MKKKDVKKPVAAKVVPVKIPGRPVPVKQVTKPVPVARPVPVYQPPPGFVMRMDPNGRTALEVSRTDEYVKFIPLDPSAGLRVERHRVENFIQLEGVRSGMKVSLSFDEFYKHVENYHVGRAVKKFFNFARTYGATDEVLGLLAPVINAPEREQQEVRDSMAAKKGPKMDEKTKAKLKAKGDGKAKKEPGAPRAKRDTAAQMFKDLIMGGHFSDDTIFKKVQEKFKLDDSKRSYVAWYRNYLKKAGQNPPAPKGA